MRCRRLGCSPVRSLQCRSASPYTSTGLERCVRDIHAAGQHVTLAPANYAMAGQAFLGSDMRASLLLMDDRGAAREA